MYCIASGLGNYKLSAEFPSAAKSPDELDLITCHSPQEIVNRLSTRDATASSDASENGKVLIKHFDLIYFVEFFSRCYACFWP